MNEILQSGQVTPKNGIWVTKEIAEQTVWDKLAKENPTHAVISAADEAAAAEKSKPQIADIKQHVSSDSVLLDLGCGYGRVAKYLLPQQSLSHYVGVDSAYEMLQLFKEHYEHSEVEQRTPLTLVNADIHTLPLINQSVDVVVVSAVFLHNHKSVVKQSVEELKRVMKPGATLLVYSSFPRKWTLMGLQGVLYQGLLNLLGKPMTNGPVRYYSKRELKNLFKEFSHIEYVYDGFAVLPKTIIILPGILERWYRLGIANPLNRLLERVMPDQVKPYFAVHFDVKITR
jgi:ubiquinone/menaquinone biosynthesis C-methylase UbiE